MLGALLGSVIISAATASLIIAIQLGDNALKNIGQNPPTQSERNIIRASGRNPVEFNTQLQEDFERLQNQWKTNLKIISTNNL